MNEVIVSKLREVISSVQERLKSEGDSESLAAVSELLISLSGVATPNRASSEEVGKTYYNLRVVKLMDTAEPSGNKLYVCECIDCGFMSIRRVGNLRRMKNPVKCHQCKINQLSPKGESRA